jgi:hypothetical protein
LDVQSFGLDNDKITSFNPKNLPAYKKPFTNSIIQRSCTTIEKPKNLKKAVQNLPTSAIFLKSTIWGPGSSGTISITFNESGAWSNIGSESTYSRPSMNLGWVDPPFGTTFDYFGTEIQIEKSEQEHRNYGYENAYKPGATVVHEFGHALGLYHEHQNNLFNSIQHIVLNSKNVEDSYTCQYCYDPDFNPATPTDYNDYLTCLNNYPENPNWKIINPNTGELQLAITDTCKNKAIETAEFNTIDRFSCEYYTDQRTPCPYAGSKFDKDSIMKYWFDPYWVSSGSTKSVPNFEFSEKDKEWILAYYPRNIEPSKYPRINVEFLDGPEWKQKWVIKMVAEHVSPITGIVWIFPGHSIMIDPSDSMKTESKKSTPLGAFPTKTSLSRDSTTSLSRDSTTSLSRDSTTSLSRDSTTSLEKRLDYIREDENNIPLNSDQLEKFSNYKSGRMSPGSITAIVLIVILFILLTVNSWNSKI